MEFIKHNKGVRFFGKEFANQTECAKYFGISKPYMCAIFAGKKPPTEKMLAKCGYRKVVNRTVTYEPIK